MFSRSMQALLIRRPPFASFFKAVSVPLKTTKPPLRMKAAGILWRKTAPQYGSRFSAPRVAAALQVYRKEAPLINRQVRMTARPGRRSAAAASQRKLVRTTDTKLKAIRVKRRQQHKKKAATPFAAFRAEVMRRTKLPSTEASRKRVLRMWVMTGQQRSLSAPKRVEMAVRLLNKNRKHTKRLSRKMSRKISKRRSKHADHRSAKRPARRSSHKLATSTKFRIASGKTKRGLRVRPSRKATALKLKSVPSKRGARRVPKKLASPKLHLARNAAAKPSASKKKAAGRSKVPKLRASRKTAVSKRRARKTFRATSRRSKLQRTVAKRRTSAARHRRNPYLRFYRYMRLTGLIPNHPKILGSRQIKALWAETHALKGLNRRIARATELLEKRTGLKSMVSPPSVRRPARKDQSSRRRVSLSSPAPAARNDLNLLTLKQSDIKVPRYYRRNPFGATYAALLPVLRDIPSSTRMSKVAKAWTHTSMKDDKRSAKARIAAVAEAMRS
ncbi:hypothetical protein MNV84_08364 [Leishmania braziliensis]|nr:hypothetical protein MNV84_08364 [Leishmania braziliensis]